MKKMVFSFAGLLMFVMVAVPPAFAQTQYGRISGKVIDQATNNGLPFVTVYLYLGEQQKLSARSNSGGNFSFVNVQPDVYTIRTSKSGYAEYAKQLRVNPNFTTKLYIPLTAGEGAAAKPIALADNVVPVAPPQEKPATISVSTTPTPAPPVVKDTPTPAVAQAPVTKQEPVQQVTKPAETPAQPTITPPVGTPVSSAPVQAPTQPVVAQQEELEAISEDTKIYEVTEVSPEIEGGASAIYKILKYPEIAMMLKVEGTVVCRVYIDKDGTPINTEVLKSVHPALDKAAQDALFNVRYTPGMQGGVPVQTMYTMPIKFKLSK